jgi:hypothetical protein
MKQAVHCQPLFFLRMCSLNKAGKKLPGHKKV